MMKNRKLSAFVNNENGSALVISVLILMLLTFLGIAATNTTSIETYIAGNEKIYKQNFYMAEGAMQEAIQRIENETIADQLRGTTSSYIWLNTCSELKDTNWDNDGQSGTVSSGASALGSRFEVFDGGIVRGSKASSIKITSSSVHEYAVYGRSTSNNGQVVVEAGFKKRF
jgi:hypothetical protein